MVLVPLGIVWGGYLIAWYGYALVRGPGMGFLDLLIPTDERRARADAVIQSWQKSSGNVPNTAQDISMGQKLANQITGQNNPQPVPQPGNPFVTVANKITGSTAASAGGGGGVRSQS